MSTPAERNAALRQFNRFYTRRIGVLHEGLTSSSGGGASGGAGWLVT